MLVEQNDCVVINSHFIGNFNNGRNIVHNLKVLGLMYRCFNSATAEEQGVLCKPILVFIGAIAEAVLFDLHYRIHSFTKEGVTGLSRTVLHAIRSTSTKKDEFWWLIKKCEANNVFGAIDHSIYQELKDLRLLRNRIHIQDKERSFEESEIDAFSLVRKIKFEKTLEFLLKELSANHGRGESLRYVDDFILPWKSYF